MSAVDRLGFHVRLKTSEGMRGARVAFDTGGRDPRQHQQVWVLDGSIEVTVGADRHALQTGDCLAFVLDKPVTFQNRARKAARYAVVIVSDAGAGR